jgi:hypothetical protein
MDFPTDAILHLFAAGLDGASRLRKDDENDLFTSSIGPRIRSRFLEIGTRLVSVVSAEAAREREVAFRQGFGEAGYSDGHVPADQVCHHRRQAVELAVQEMILHGHVPPL